MNWLISFLRMKLNDNDSSIWTDDQLQDYLDMHCVHICRELLRHDSGRFVYYSAFRMLEDGVRLWDSPLANAAEIPDSSYVPNLIDGAFTFTLGQNGRYYLDANSYNMHAAIAECLEQLAMDRDRAKAWSRGAVSYTHYDLMEMSRYHRNLSGIQSTALVKTYGRK